MLFATPRISRDLGRQLGELDEQRRRLGDRTAGAGPWLGSLRRRWRASSAGSSIAIEGFHVPEGEALAIVAGGQVPDPDDEDRMALSCYARAMDHVGVMAADPGFHWIDRVILDLHFDACSFQLDREPGRYRRRGVEVTSARGGPPDYTGPPGDEVPGLMGELVAWLDRGDPDAHVAVRAAMAHLHVVSVHPFADGNGRVARIVQSLVLAGAGLSAPELVSIEEHLGANTGAYYATLRQVQGGSYRPERDTTPWVRFCIGAHLEQAGRRLEQIAEAAARWALLEDVVDGHDWPDRLVIALEQSLFRGVDRASYATEAAVSVPTAGNDLRRLRDAGLVVQRGRGRSTRYVASERLQEDVRAHGRERRIGE
ncbi:MAG: Fic family protein [Thermoleophilaceae bacterium]